MVGRVVFQTDMSLFRACTRPYVLNSVSYGCVKSLDIVVHIAKDYSRVSPVIHLQVFNLKFQMYKSWNSRGMNGPVWTSQEVIIQRGFMEVC